MHAIYGTGNSSASLRSVPYFNRILALFFTVEKQDFLQALPLGDKAVPVYRRPGIMPVLLDSVCISPAVSDTPVQQALSSQRTLLPQAVL